jgi:hypothetical protein
MGLAELELPALLLAGWLAVVWFTAILALAYGIFFKWRLSSRPGHALLAEVRL